LGELVDVRPISEGTVQTNYLLITVSGRYVFRYYENRPPGSVQFEVNLLNYLKWKSFPCPAPHQNNHGESIGTYKGKPYVLYDFIEGEHIPDLNEAQRCRLIGLAAELNKLTYGYQSEYAKYRLNYTIDACRRLAWENSERINTPNSKGICHCDFHYLNLLFKDGEITALLDFDDANETYLTFDLAYMLRPFLPAFEWNTWNQFDSTDNILDFTTARTAVSEYSMVRPLAEQEKRHLFDVLKLSILVDCLWYFERGDVTDFFEKRKLESLDRFGRDRFYSELFGSESGLND
jgi:Ser/Thr protein kinase RdoA (MazF antagonist)